MSELPPPPPPPPPPPGPPEAPVPRGRPRSWHRSVAGMPVAGLGLRFAGNLLDSLIYVVVFVLSALLVGALAEPEPTSTPAERWEDERAWEDDWSSDDASAEEDRLAALALIGPLLVYIFQCVLVMRRGQSIGKCAVKTRIVDHRTGGHPGFLQLIVLRSILPTIFAQFCGLFGLIDALVIFGEERRCVHDLMAKTSVVEANAVPHTAAADVFE